MNTQVCTLCCALVVFVVLLWVSYLRKEKDTGSSYEPPTGTEKYGLVGRDGDRYGYIHTSDYLSAWAPDWTKLTQGGNPVSALTVSQLDNGIFVRVNYNDLRFYTSRKLSNYAPDWTIQNGDGDMVIQLQDGKIAAVGRGAGNIMTSPGRTPWVWTKIEGDGRSYKLIQLKDGTFVVIGLDHHFWTLKRLTNDTNQWVKVDGDDWWWDIKQLRDGTFVAIDNNTNMCISKKLSNRWTDWTVLPDKSIRPRSLFIYYE